MISVDLKNRRSIKEHIVAKAAIGGKIIIESNKRTSIGRKNIKMASMNKSSKRSFKKYRGQG